MRFHHRLDTFLVPPRREGLADVVRHGPVGILARPRGLDARPFAEDRVLVADGLVVTATGRAMATRTPRARVAAYDVLAVLAGAVIPTAVEVVGLGEVPGASLAKAASVVLVAVPDAKGTPVLPRREEAIRAARPPRDGADGGDAIPHAEATVGDVTLVVPPVTNAFHVPDAGDVATDVEATVDKVAVVAVAPRPGVLPSHAAAADTSGGDEGVVRPRPIVGVDTDGAALATGVGRPIAVQAEETGAPRPSPDTATDGLACRGRVVGRPGLGTFRADLDGGAVEVPKVGVTAHLPLRPRPAFLAVPVGGHVGLLLDLYFYSGCCSPNKNTENVSPRLPC